MKLYSHSVNSLTLQTGVEVIDGAGKELSDIWNCTYNC